MKPGDLVLDGPTLAQIYLGKITKWNDPAIKKLNPKPQSARSRHRATFTAPTARAPPSTSPITLSEVSPDWKSSIGEATTVEWPSGIGAKGNDGVANNVATTTGAIGYVEFAYAEQNKLTYASMINKAGKTVAPTMDAFQAAAANADWEHAPGFYQILANQPGDKSWPMTAATFILMYKKPANVAAVERRAPVLQVGLREGRQDGRRTSTTSRCPTTSSSWSRRCGLRTSSRNDRAGGRRLATLSAAVAISSSKAQS